MAGLIAWEDLAATRSKKGVFGKPGDADYNDAVFEVSIVNLPTNTPAVIGDPALHEVNEDQNVQAGNLVASGTISIVDPDIGEAAFQTSVVPASGNLGSLTLSANGAYTFSVANSAVQSLGEGDTKVDTFTIKSIDGATKEVRFTIYGTNDAAGEKPRIVISTG